MLLEILITICHLATMGDSQRRGQIGNIKMAGDSDRSAAHVKYRWSNVEVVVGTWNSACQRFSIEYRRREAEQVGLLLEVKASSNGTVSKVC